MMATAEDSKDVLTGPFKIFPGDDSQRHIKQIERMAWNFNSLDTSLVLRDYS